MADLRRLALDNAARLFRTQGYAAVTMRDIAAACEVKAGSLYYHFASKEQIVVEVLNTGVNMVIAEVLRHMGRLPAGAVLALRLRTAIAAHLHTLLGRNDYIGANIRIFAHVPDRVRIEALAHRQLYEAWWQDLLDQGARDGAFRPGTDLRLVRLFLMGAMNWSLEWHHFHGQAPSGQDSSGQDAHVQALPDQFPRGQSSGAQDVDAIADRLAALVLHGVSAPAAPG